MSEDRTIERAYRVRVRFTRAQTRLFRRLCGAKRFVWNWALRRKDEAYRADGTKLDWIALSREFTVLKAQPDTAWLAELPREPFNQVLRDFDRAWENFFASRARRPRRKKRGAVDSVRFTLDQRREQVQLPPDPEKMPGLEPLAYKTGVVLLPGLGRVRFRVTEPMAGRLRSVTLRMDAAGRVFAAFAADGVPAPAAMAPERDAVGIDAGVKDTLVLSNGLKIEARKALREKERRLRRYQRSFARKMIAAKARIGLGPKDPIPKGVRLPVSNRMRRQRRRIGMLHARVVDARRNHQHHASRAAVNAAEVLVIEDLPVGDLCRGPYRRFRRAVHDAGLGELRRQIEYKAAWAGRRVIVASREFPSSQICSACGHVNAGLDLKDRRWTCPACKAAHDRDLNAAINLENEARRVLAGEESSTARSAGIDARGEAACAAGRTPPAGLPTSMNREESRNAARRFPSTPGREPEKRGMG